MKTKAIYALCNRNFLLSKKSVLNASKVKCS